MKTELSAGAIIFHKKNSSSWEVLLIRDKQGNLTFPKGLVEPKEDKKDAAIREAKEETGITRLTYKDALKSIHYYYTRDNEKISKTVAYFIFLADTKEPLHPQIAEGIQEVLWMPIEKAIIAVGYPKSNKPLLIEAKNCL